MSFGRQTLDLRENKLKLKPTNISAGFGAETLWINFTSKRGTKMKKITLNIVGLALLMALSITSIIFASRQPSNSGFSGAQQNTNSNGNKKNKKKGNSNMNGNSNGNSNSDMNGNSNSNSNSDMNSNSNSNSNSNANFSNSSNSNMNTSGTPTP